MENKKFIKSLGCETMAYIGYDINGYLGWVNIKSKDLEIWADIVEKEKPDYTLADKLNADRIMKQLITICNIPEKLAFFKFNRNEYLNLHCNNESPIDQQSILFEVLNKYKVIEKVFDDPVKMFFNNINDILETLDSAKEIKKEYNKNKTKKTKKEKQNSGIVYLVKIKGENHYKIGVSKQFNKRVDRLSTLMPFELKTINKIKTKNIYSLEKMLHNKFKNKHIKGEWFKLEKKDVNYIKSIEDKL